MRPLDWHAWTTLAVFGRPSVQLVLGAMLAGTIPTNALSDDPAQGSRGQSTGIVQETGHLEGETQRLEELDALIRDGRYRDAEERGEALLAEIEASGRAESLSAALALDRLVAVWLLADKDRVPRTLQSAQRAVSIKQRHFGVRNPETARSMMLLGRVHLQRQEFALAHEELAQALEISTSTLGAGHPQTADCVYQIGRLHAREGNYAEARPWVEKAVALREAAFGRADASVGQALSMLGDCIVQGGNFAAALPLLRESVDISERALGPTHPAMAPILGTLGMHLYNDGQYTEAQTLLERVLRIYEDTFGADSPRVTYPLLYLGTIALDTGQYGRAEQLFLREQALELKHYGADDDRYATGSLGGLALLNAALKNYPAAIELWDRVAEIYAKSQGPTSWAVANALAEKGMILLEYGRTDEAEAALMRGLEICKTRFAADEPAVAVYLTRIARVRMDKGDVVGARAAVEEALTILEKAPEHNRWVRMDALDVLSLVDEAEGRNVEALELQQQRLTLATNFYGHFHPETARALTSHARLLAVLGRADEAVAEAGAAESVFREYVTLVARSAAEPLAVAYAANRESALNLLLTLAAHDGGHVPDAAGVAVDALVRSRGRVLDELMERKKRAIEAQDQEGLRILAELQQATDRLANLVIRGPQDGDVQPYPERVARAREERNRVEREMAQHSSSEYRVGASVQAGLKEVQAALPAGTALLGYAEFEVQSIEDVTKGSGSDRRKRAREYVVYVVTQGESPPMLIRVGDAQSVESTVRQWRDEVLRQAQAIDRPTRALESRYRRVATDLRRLIWDPVAGQLRNMKLTLVVPDGTLNLVDLGALPVGEEGYLVEARMGIQYLSSERDLLAQSPPGRAPRGLLVVSHPDYETPPSGQSLARLQPLEKTSRAYRGTRSGCGDFVSMRFGDLPATAEESRDVISLWKRQDRRNASDEGSIGGRDDYLTLSGVEAGETTFKQVAGQYSILHIATHGFFLESLCGSALYPAANGVEAASTSAAIARENPLLLSGIALAGANRRGAGRPEEDDGILTAEEVATLDLHATQWAVLSACDTGKGEVRGGEGVFGLRRAFQVAGARTVIMSLWPVEDEATRQWMTALYRHRFAEGQTTAESVSRASVDLLRQKRARGESTHPFYWAGFVAAGDWR